MKVNFRPIVYKTAGVMGIAGMFLLPSKSAAQNNNFQINDTFESTSVIPQGTYSPAVLFNAPSPCVNICGEMKNAVMVVDLSQNVLYHYDENGNADCAYLVASGKKSTPTSSGVRVVSHVETYPYRYAPANSKRRNNPGAYGPKIICVDVINPKTGEKSPTGEFIHGNANPDSLGKYASKGCIRMDNTVIKELSSVVKKGDIIVILPNNKIN